MAKSELLLIRDASRIPDGGPVAATHEQIKGWLEGTSPADVEKIGQTYADAEKALRKAAEELPKIAKRLASEWGSDTSPHVQKALQMLNATGLGLASAMGLMATSLKLYGGEYLPEARKKVAAIPPKKPDGTEENAGGGTTGIPRSESGEGRDPDKEAQKVLQDLNERIVELYAMYIPTHVFYEVPEVDIPSDTGTPPQRPDLNFTFSGDVPSGAHGGGSDTGGIDRPGDRDGQGGPGSQDARDPHDPGRESSGDAQDGSQPGERGAGSDDTSGQDATGPGQDQQPTSRDDGQAGAPGDRETAPAVIGRDSDPRSTESASYVPQQPPLPHTAPIATQHLPGPVVGGQPAYGVPSVLGGPNQYGTAAAAGVPAVTRGMGGGPGMIPPILGGAGADSGGEEYTTDLSEDRNPFVLHLDVTGPMVGESH